ncbi:MAG: polyphosphate kinase 2 [Pseudomonadota bacterium]
MKIADAPVVELQINGKKRTFDLDDPKLPDWVDDNAFGAGGYPYDKKMDEKKYKHELEDLQEELVKVQYWLQEKDEKVLVVFEGRDAAGKGGTIERFRQNLNPRYVRSVALPKPSDKEQGQWYFQRYASNFPTSGEMILFDRSWYNRAGVEPVMGFCTDDQYESFLDEAPKFEKMIKRAGIHFFKFWLNIGQETQLERFHARRHDPLKVWKLSPVDIKALTKWDEYTKARDKMFKHTDVTDVRWCVVRANDKRRSRINSIRHVLTHLDYEGKNKKKIGEIDENIVVPAKDFKD